MKEARDRAEAMLAALTENEIMASNPVESREEKKATLPEEKGANNINMDTIHQLLVSLSNLCIFLTVVNKSEPKQNCTSSDCTPFRAIITCQPYDFSNSHRLLKVLFQTQTNQEKYPLHQFVKGAVVDP